VLAGVHAPEGSADDLIRARVPAKEVDRLDALLDELDTNDARRDAERDDPFAHPSTGTTRE
jgi:hypothetical protein